MKINVKENQGYEWSKLRPNSSPGFYISEKGSIAIMPSIYTGNYMVLNGTIGTHICRLPSTNKYRKLNKDSKIEIIT